MAISDPTVIGFCDSKIRPMSNNMLALYYMSLAVKTEWTGRGGSSFIIDDSQEIKDGADKDARPVIDGAAVNDLIGTIDAFVTMLEANDKAQLNALIAVANESIVTGITRMG